MRALSRLAIACALAGPIVGCGEPAPLPTVDGGPRDLAAASDLATATDLSAATDLATAPDLVPADLAGAHRFVLDQITVPTSNTQFAWDLNGDGKPDDQLGSIDGALKSQGLDPQTAMDQSIAAGSNLNLVEIDTSDPQLLNDASASATLFAAKATASPDFSGNGSFTVDNQVAPALFTGPLAAAKLTSADPEKASVPVRATLMLPLFGPPVRVPITAARITFTAASSGLTQGQLNGAITKADVDGVLTPAVAANLTAEIAANPNSSTSMQLESLFDTGGCSTNGQPATAGDKIISPCELAQSSIYQNLTAPDVDLFDAQDNYHPNPANSGKDSLSVGVGFHAVRATF